MNRPDEVPMRILSVEREYVPPPPPPPKPPVKSVTLVLTAEEAQHLFWLVGRVGGNPKEFPQRRTYDKLYAMLHDNDVVNTDIDANPLTFKTGTGGAYLSK
jgi:hypothetical protein